MHNQCIETLEQELVHEAAYRCARILVCDVTQCLRCGACEDACGRRHGRSRLAGEWLDCGVVRIAPACRQCADAACCAACRRYALHRDGTGVVFEPADCVACGACSRACPFGAIQVERENGNGKGGSGAKDRVEPHGATGAVIRCDGCRGFRYPVCVHECPTGALAFRSRADLWDAAPPEARQPAAEQALATLAAAEASSSGRDVA